MRPFAVFLEPALGPGMFLGSPLGPRPDARTRGLAGPAVRKPRRVERRARAAWALAPRPGRFPSPAAGAVLGLPRQAPHALLDLDHRARLSRGVADGRSDRQRGKLSRC